MDRRTADLLDVLEHPGAAFLIELLSRPATEAELVEAVKGTTQATANRRLACLERAGLVAREPGKPRAPGRRWAVLHAAEVDALVQVAFRLSRVVAQAEEDERRKAESALKRARAARLGIGEAGGGDAS